MRGRYDGAPGLALTAEMRFLHYGLVQDPYRILKAEVLGDAEAKTALAAQSSTAAAEFRRR